MAREGISNFVFEISSLVFLLVRSKIKSKGKVKTQK